MTDKQNPKILLVDDEPVSIKILEKTLIKEGYNIILANNGPEARKLASEYLPDIILLDVMMPGEDGFEVANQLKKDPGTASIPVIFLTGRDDLEGKVKAFDLGAVDYVTKPFHGEEVLARIRLHLKLSLATNSLIASQAEKLMQIKDAQKSLFITPEEVPDARFCVCFMALLEAGGDFYEVLRISEGIFGYFVSDVSGHDIATSYLTSALKALLKQNCIPIYQPVESIRIMNNVLEEILPDGKYLTACYARLNRKKKHMSIVNCGHPPAVYLPKQGEAMLIDSSGDVLGIFKDVYFGTKNLEVHEGDRFFLYSDGLIEKPGKRKIWTEGLDNLLNACDRLRDVPIHESAERLRDMMDEGTKGFEDDVVILGIEV